jgi:hypothetical protein
LYWFGYKLYREEGCLSILNFQRAIYGDNYTFWRRTITQVHPS